MNKTLALTVLMIAMTLGGSSCGKKEAEPQGGAPVAGAAKPAARAAATIDPAENLGKKIGSSYIETLKQVVAILQDKPPAADAKAMLTDLKSWTIELMVGLGKEREALSVADRAKVDQELRGRIASVPADLFKSCQEGQAFYGSDRELFNLIADFNAITQYANFDLLKKQLPEEAKRLGIN